MNKFLYFVAGLGIGSVITWKLTEQYYRQLANEEIESVVQRFKELEHRFEEGEKVNIVGVSGEQNDEEVKNYNQIAHNYVPEEKYEDASIKEDEQDLVGPYVISPEEFGENGYEIRSLTLYSDNTLVDNEDQTIAIPEHVLGDALEHMGEYEDDAVHVRDDMNKIDYEVIKVDQTFREAYNNNEEE